MITRDWHNWTVEVRRIADPVSGEVHSVSYTYHRPPPPDEDVTPADPDEVIFDDPRKLRPPYPPWFFKRRRVFMSVYTPGESAADGS